MTTNEKSNLFFRKKVYASIYKPSSFELDGKSPPKKIIPSSKISGLREDFKKVFLPLLIDVFELRKRIQNYKLGVKSPFGLKSETSCPSEILIQLTSLQKDIEESKRWCEGVIQQISKGIEEAKEALQYIEKMHDKSSDEIKSPSLKKRLCKFFLKK
jgi:hypothetical protein